MPKRRWSNLSRRTRRLIILGAIAESVLKIAALVDIKRRPADRVNGSKVKWATAVALVNSLGIVPLAYFRYGRRQTNGT